MGVGKKSLLKQGKQNLRTIISDEKVEAAESVSGWNFVKICVIMQDMTHRENGGSTVGRPKNIIFDVGDVLIEYRWKQMLMDYGLEEDDAIRVGREMFDDPERLWSIFDLGTLTQEDVIRQFQKKHPEDAEVIAWFINHGEYMHVPRPGVWKLVHQLKEAGYKLYILSNYPEKLFKKHTEYADFMADMDGVLVSYMNKKAKPSPEIFAELCQRFGLVPEECLFFDDREENVRGAIDFGIPAKRVWSAKGLEEDLHELLALK